MSPMHATFPTHLILLDLVTLGNTALSSNYHSGQEPPSD